jgi:hypothetical protein
MSRVCALLAWVAVLLSLGAVVADCECFCIDGYPQPICDNVSDQPHACKALACSSPNSDAVQEPNQTPPSGIATCALEQVEDSGNPSTRMVDDLSVSEFLPKSDYVGSGPE